MQLTTPTDIPSYPFDINHHHKLTFIGSCFADNIGQQFQQNKFSALINPYGVQYNPASVCQCLDSILSDNSIDSQLIQHDGLWSSFLHHSSFSKVSKEECLRNINANKREAKTHLEQSDILFLTFGTAHVFEYQGRIISNCHKIPAKKFNRRRLDTNEIVESVKATLQKLHAINPNLKIIFTVSPVRYTKDGMNANNLSKATLLLSIEELCRTDNCYYFPAYEIVIDELRDYRFFAEDLVHPNKTTIKILWEKLSNTFFNTDTIQLCKQINNIVAASQHRPFNINPEAHQQFLMTMQKKASDLQNRHSELDLSAEIAYFSQK